MQRCLLLVVLTAVAGVGVAAQMPDFAQMAGRPLPAPELPTGSVAVRVVRQQMGNNVVGHPVTLRATDRTLNGTTDAQGRAQFADVPVGTSITVETTVDGELLRSQSIVVPPQGGVRVALIAGLGAAQREASQRPAQEGSIVFGGDSRIVFEFQDDNLQVFYLLDVVNRTTAPVALRAPVFIVFPDGAVGAGALNGSSMLAVVQNDRLRLNGPFPPGVTQVQVGYRFPYRGTSATLVQQWPAEMEQLFVAVEKIGALTMTSAQFQQQQEANAGGAPFLMATGATIEAGQTLTIELNGLPQQSRWVRNAGFTIGLLLLAAGFTAAFTGRSRAPQPGAELAARREQLLSELVALEQRRSQGKLDDRRYLLKRQSLVSQLERIMGELAA